MPLSASTTKSSLALLTDLYQLTMSYGYWKLGRSEQEAVFHLFFRTPPFKGQYAIAAGLSTAVDFLQQFNFDDSDIAFLKTLSGNDGQPLFSNSFLQYLADLKFSCDVDAMPEGTLAFGSEPIVRLRGPILQCQLLETALLNIINFQTLVATKASRICGATGGESVLEFGLRRAQGIDGGLSASRAAYIGGCAATSNVLAGKLYDIPVKGTHAHSWVMSFDSEQASFDAYADAMPNNCVFLVDTYDTLRGVQRAVEVGERLRENGYEMVGIRLDSGDLAQLSIEARKLLDEAGFQNAAIVASNDLDEYTITQLKANGAKIAVWGVGTKLATAYDQPALGGVYKLGAIKDADGTWVPKIKRSEQAIKTSIPGTLQVRRIRNSSGFTEDVIYDENAPLEQEAKTICLNNTNDQRQIEADFESEDLLKPVFRGGKAVWNAESLGAARERCADQLTMLSPSVQTLSDASPYRVSLERNLHILRQKMINDTNN